MKAPRPITSLEAEAALKRIDYLVGGEGYAPLKKQPPSHVGDDVWRRMYEHKDGGGVSLAFTGSELQSPATEFGLMVQARLTTAKRNTP